MLATIQLDDQLLFEADEIDDEFSDRLLASEFGPFDLPGTQSAPQHGFNPGCTLSKLPGGGCQVGKHL
jgi:hypothetical protein